MAASPQNPTKTCLIISRQRQPTNYSLVKWAKIAVGYRRESSFYSRSLAEDRINTDRHRFLFTANDSQVMKPQMNADKRGYSVVVDDAADFDFRFSEVH